MLNQVADGVWVRQSARVWSNAIAVRGQDGLILVDVVVAGHGAVAEGPEVAARLAADRAYIDALRREEEPADARLRQDWLSGPHQSTLERARHSSA
jgi:hypothetical protein